MPNPTYDVCIIGGGPAGIILALEYSRLRPEGRVLLVELGGGSRNTLDDTIEVRNPVNHHPPYECTNKGLGGTSATWGGRCVMYDEVDFIDRPIVGGGCTWDMSLFDEVQQYLARAAAYFECGEPVFNLDGTEWKNERIAEGYVPGDVTDNVVERWSMPTRFGKRYGAELKALPHLTYMEGYEARSFSEPDQAGKVRTLSLRDTQTGEDKQVDAAYFVLAAGAQESTRLLLRNPQLFRLTGRTPEALGRYYQGHLSGKIASVRFNGDPSLTHYGFHRDTDGVYLRRRFQFTTDFLVKHNLLNTAIWLDNPLYHNPGHRSGAMSFMYLAMITPVIGKKLAPPAIAQSVTKGKKEGISRHLWNVLKDLPGSLITPATIFYKRYCIARKLPGIFLYSPSNRYALHFHAEQVPDSSNRMELGPDGETLVIHYDLTGDDIRSVIRLHQKLDESLRETGSGYLEYWYPEEELEEAIREMSRDGIHQSGTTRIAAGPEKGVVDPNLRVFGTQNVFVCSSSVFPTSGQANPTFFLGAFATRLADHLTKQVYETN